MKRIKNVNNKNFLKSLLIKRKKNKKRLFYLYFSKLLVLVGIFLLFASYAPSIYYLTQKAGIDLNMKLIGETATKKSTADIILSYAATAYTPPFDPLLPEENTLIITSVGIETVIIESSIEDYESAIKKGVWRVNNFGTPEFNRQPVILAAHRFGYLAWSIPYRLKNSFYKLPKVNIGDVISIVWKQRKYNYSVYAQSTGEEIEDYKADLILYTCRDLKSPVRIFKYARLMEI